MLRRILNLSRRISLESGKSYVSLIRGFVIYSLRQIWVIKSRRIRFAWHSACIDIRNPYFVRKVEGKKLYGRPNHGWENIIKN